MTERLSECPQCYYSITQPRTLDDYCENCGWPDEDRTQKFKLTCHTCKGVSVVKICQDAEEEFTSYCRGNYIKDQPTFPHCPFCGARLGGSAFSEIT
jgi:hypothetical protein